MKTFPKSGFDWHINSNKIREPKNYSLESYFSESIFHFHKQLESYSPTPLIELSAFSSAFKNTRILLKDESMRMGTGAFKALGASWAINSYLNRYPGKHVFCTATDGNHGRSVAWSARIFNQKAVVFMPAGTVEARIENIKKEGARVNIVDGDYDLTVQTAQKAAIENNYVLIQDTAFENYTEIPQFISAGYITMLKEIEIQLNANKQNMPDFVILQSGVGSWAASMILYLRLKYNRKSPRFIIAEPYESDCILESAKQNKLSKTQKSQQTIMAGLNCGTPSITAWEIIHDLADALVSIPDSYAERAMRVLNNPDKGAAPIESCESGAAGLAAYLAIFEADELKGLKGKLSITNDSSFLIFNTEGITDPVAYRKIVG
ncbi:MAG: diaminopropionate ammonia-lyase [Bacteroidales bacterium]|nr:diaminopropionate ammonia-lyase [Bacteroidales bacterium]MCF8391357.1 diaminopropionate ammonia-lyase [Bacteroidales bacterium]